MALSEDQKQKILYHLNIPALSIVSGSTHYNSIVNDRLVDITNEIQDIVEKILEDIQCAEDELASAKKCLKVAAIGDIRMNTDHLHNLKFEYKRLRNKLSDTLDISMKRGGSTIGVIT